ncbi:hypothetical protein BC30090_2672 [Bacillus cereus]|nr:hypothetical protein BC30090_2672 [Bacillus cereus]
MIDVIRLVIFTVVAIGAIINIYIEFKNLKKYILNRFFISTLNWILRIN